MEDELENLSDEGEAPESRFMDAASARSVFDAFFEADKESSRKRAMNQLMFDGAPPYNPEELVSANQAYRTNVNFGEAEDILTEAQGAYVDMLQSIEHLFTAETAFGATQDERNANAKEVCAEISRMIRAWPGYLHQYLLRTTTFISQGVSVPIFRDHIDWRYDVKGLADFYVPRDSDAMEDFIEVAYSRETFTITELFNYIREEEAADSLGWDVEAVKKALLDHATKGNDRTGSQSWEDFATEMKTDDLRVSARSNVVEVLYCWTREFDGSVTQYIMTRKPGTTDKEFLYTKREKYASMSEAFVFFTYGVGNKGKLYEVRGLGSKIFSAVQVLNRMMCQHIDGSMIAASLVIRPKDANALGKAQISLRGPYTVLHPGSDIVETGSQNFSQNTLGVSRQMSDLIRTKAGSVTTSRALPDDGRDMSQFEASARISNAAGMTVTNLILYLEQEEKLLRQQVRRIINPEYNKDLPGGEFIEILHERLLAKGIPLEALYQLDVNSIKATRPVGAGSAAARDNAFRQLQEMAPAFDEVGRRNLTRMRAANILGSFISANEFVPPPTQARIPEGTKVAMLENIAMKAGESIEVFPEEFHIAHLGQHTAAMQQYVQAAEEGSATLAELVPMLFQLHEHSLAHLDFINSDPAAQAEAAMYRQALQNSGEILLNGMRQLEAENRANGGPVAEGQEQPAVDPKQQEFIAKMQRDMQLHQFNMQKLADKAALDQQIAIGKANVEAQVIEVKAMAQLSPQALQRQRR